MSGLRNYLEPDVRRDVAGRVFAVREEVRRSACTWVREARVALDLARSAEAAGRWTAEDLAELEAFGDSILKLKDLIDRLPWPAGP